jgi:ribosomal protein S18 acetylase RimI-like enzyme
VENVQVSVEIRLARPSEYAEIGEITVAAYHFDGHLEGDTDYADELRDAAGRAAEAELWVAVDDGDLLGTVTYCPPGSPYRELSDDDEGEFRMLAVNPAHRRRGAARALVEHCIQRSRDAGHRRVVMCSLPTMTAAHRLYEDLGFVRAPELDMRPVPHILLIGFTLDLESARGDQP